MPPKDEYMDKINCCDEEDAKEGLFTLYNYGFPCFDSNLAMLKSCQFSVNMAVNGLIDLKQEEEWKLKDF